LGAPRTPGVYDAVIVGGGPAGLSAALVLGRARRRVLLFDHGRYRNAATRRMHGYLTRDGIRPPSFRAIARRELEAYGVEIRREEVLDVRRGRAGFRVLLPRRRSVRSTMLLLATGVVDRIPAIPGIEPLYGASVHHCPYCDGWEWRDRRLAAYGRGQNAVALAHSLKGWSADVMLLTDGGRVGRDDLRELTARGIPVVTRRVLRLQGTAGMLRRIHVHGVGPLERDALFFSTANDQSCDIGFRLGCRATSKSAIWTNRREGTNVTDVYVAGDASSDIQSVIVAAAEGAKAAVAINKELLSRERAAARERSRRRRGM
jgi:thioredoxin reductase